MNNNTPKLVPITFTQLLLDGRGAVLGLTKEGQVYQFVEGLGYWKPLPQMGVAVEP